MRSPKGFGLSGELVRVRILGSVSRSRAEKQMLDGVPPAEKHKARRCEQAEENEEAASEEPHSSILSSPLLGSRPSKSTR
jgi:hypothetical protein